MRLSAAAAVFFLFFSYSSAFAQTGGERAVLITADKVTEGATAPVIDITGTVYFSLSSAVAAESSGKVAKVYVNEGDKVKAGEPLAALDDKLITYEITSAEAQAAQSKASLAKAERDYGRNKSLYEQQAVSQLAYDDALTAYRNAESAYLASVANEKKLKAEKEKMIVRAPFAGTVTSKEVNAGEWVNAGGVVANVAASDFEAKIYLPEKVLPFIKTGDTVLVTAASKKFKGKVLSVNSKGDPATRTFQARIRLGADPSLKEGILATARIPAGKTIKTLLVPRDAVITENGVQGVFTFENDTARFVPVIIGANAGLLRGITPLAALKAGDPLIISGKDRVREGAKVRIAAEFSK